jgi:hypothetical protein
MRNTKGLIAFLMITGVLLTPDAALSQSSLLKTSEPERFGSFLPPAPAVPWWLETVTQSAPTLRLPGDPGPLVLRPVTPDTQLSSNLGSSGTSAGDASTNRKL